MEVVIQSPLAIGSQRKNPSAISASAVKILFWIGLRPTISERRLQIGYILRKNGERNAGKISKPSWTDGGIHA